MEYLIYDCEILKCIPQQGITDTAYDYCNGWHDHKGMGISVVGVVNKKGDAMAYVGQADLSGFERAVNHQESPIALCGFNSKSFDDNLMKAHGVSVTTDYDILDEIRLAAFGSTNWRDTPSGHSYKLGAIGAANGFPKTGTGELAPQLWQQGRQQEVIDYCLNDVQITRSILELGLRGELVDPNTNRFLKLRSLEEVCLRVSSSPSQNKANRA